MGAYAIRRLLLFAPTLIGATLLIFVVMRILPGDVARTILAGPTGENRYTQEDIDRVHRDLHLDDPIPVQYLRWLGDAVRLDFGRSYVRVGPVSSEVFRRFYQVTLELALLSILIALLLGITSGVIQATMRGTIYDAALRAVSIGGLAMPAFWVGAVLLMISVNLFTWVPPLGFSPIWDDPLKNLQQVALPALSLGYLLSASVARMVRATTLEALTSDYIRTARAKGLRPSAVVLRHALRNSLLPVITIAGLQFGALLGGTVIIEQLFNLPGMGGAAADAIRFGDYPTVQFSVVMFSLIFMSVNLSVDLAYGIIDPRVTYGSN